MTEAPGNSRSATPTNWGFGNTVLSDEFDATWVFLNWEGVEAEALAAPLTYFKMQDYGIPYSYSPVIAANENKLSNKEAAYKSFLAATKQGYLYCRKHPGEAVELFKKYVPKKDAKIDLTKALAATASSFGDAQTWGRMEERVVGEFLSWNLREAVGDPKR